MITRTADGTRINKPARYRQSETDPAANSGSRPSIRPKVLPKTKSKPKTKAKSKPKARRSGRGRGRAQPKKTYSASTIPPTFIHADISSLPYGSLEGMGAHSSLMSSQNAMPSACNSSSLLQRPIRVDGPEIPDVYDPIDDRFSDDEMSECGSTGTRVVPPVPSSAGIAVGHGSTAAALTNVIAGRGSTTIMPNNFTAGRGSTTTLPNNFTAERGSTTTLPNNFTAGRGSTTTMPNNFTAGRGSTTTMPNNFTAGRGSTTTNPSNFIAGRGSTTTLPNNFIAGRGSTTTNPNNFTAGRGSTTIMPNNFIAGRGSTTTLPNNFTAGRGSTTTMPNNFTARRGSTTTMPTNFIAGRGSTTTLPNNFTAGRGSTTTMPNNFTAGRGSTTTMPNNFTAGRGSTTTNPSNFIAGRGSTTTLPNNFIAGRGSTTTMPNNFIAGRGSTTTMPNNFIAGRGSTTTMPTNFIAGRGSTTTNPSTSTAGRGSTATMPNNFIAGRGSTTTMPNNFTAGLGSTTTNPNNFTAGRGSTTTMPNNFTAGRGSTTTMPNNFTAGRGSTTTMPSNFTAGRGSTTTMPSNFTAGRGSTTTNPNNCNTGSGSSTSIPPIFTNFDAEASSRPLFADSHSNECSPEDPILRFLAGLTTEELGILLDPSSNEETLKGIGTRNNKTGSGGSPCDPSSATSNDAREHQSRTHTPAQAVLQEIELLLGMGARSSSMMHTAEHNVLEPNNGEMTDTDTEDLQEAHDSDIPQQVPARRGVGINWHHVEDFDDEDIAQAWLDNRDYCSNRVNYTKKYGFKQYYYCKQCGKPSKNSEQSEAAVAAGRNPIGEQIYLQYHNSSTKVSLFSNSGEHVHPERPAQGLHEVVKEFIKRKVEEGVVDLPTIWDKLDRRATRGKITAAQRPKNKRQVKNYLQRVKLDLNGGSNQPSISDLRQMATSHSALPSESEPHKVFVVHSNFTEDARGISFQIIFSTRRCIEASRSSAMLCTDATHKLTFHNYPVLPLGLADYHNHTFPIALGLCGHERAADYKELLRSLDIGALRMGLLVHSPQFVMADGDPAITAAVNEVFPDAGRSMCWFHMKRNVEDYMEKDLKMNDEAIFPIMRDLAYIQLAVTEQAFRKMFELFNDLYENENPSLLAYIRRQWIEKPPYNSWYEGFAPRLPSTNNSLESMNNQLKIKVLREKLPLGSFVTKITQKIVNGYSLALDSDLGTTDRVFEHIDEVKVPKTLFASAAKWASTEPMHIIKIPPSGGAYVFVRSRGASTSYLDLDHIHQYLGTLFGTYEHQDFASMAGMMSKIYMITIPQNASNWRHFHCTCPSFLKNKTCLHCIGIGSRQGLLNQEDRFSMPIQRNPRRQGRASKARNALTRSLTLDAAAQDRFHDY